MKTKLTKAELSLLAGSVIVSFFVCEIALRVYFPPPAPRAIVVGTTDTEKAAWYGWAMPPHTDVSSINPDTNEIVFYKLNSQGWKDSEHSFKKPPGIKRVLVLGDSVVYGMVPANELFTRQIERLFQNAGHRVEVISMGLSGWGTDQILEALEREGIRYQPDVVIYQSSDNDFTDNVFPNRYTDPNPSGWHWKKTFKYELVQGKLARVALTPRKIAKTETTSPPSKTRPVLDLFLKSAMLYHLNECRHFLRGKYQSWVAHRNRVRPDFTGKETDYHADPYSPYVLGEKNPEISDMILLMDALLVRMNQVTKNQGAKLVVWHANGDLGWRDWQLKWKRLSNDAEGDYVISAGERRAVIWNRGTQDIQTLCLKQGISFLAPKRKYSRFEYDTHPNRLGNEEMALDIFEHLNGTARWF